MNSSGLSGGYSGTQDGDSYSTFGSLYGGREPGARRRKLAGYLKAANELRQTYQQAYMQSWNDGSSRGEDGSMPGAFPDAAVARGNGGEELVIFPSYARRHTKSKPRAVPGTIQEAPGTGRDVRDSTGAGDAEFWKQQWDQYEDDNAIVDVDVRGWLFTPHSGPLTRKHRLFVGLARQMVGIPAPPAKSPSNSASNSRASSPHGLRERAEARVAKHEDEIVAKEAELILRKGQAEAEIARQGGYSENPSHGRDPSQSSENLSIHNGPSRDVSPISDGHGRRPSSRPQSEYGDANISQLEHRTSWNNPSEMSPAELSTANGHLMSRLRPFLANPSINIPISAVFFNDEKSHLKTIETNASGQFAIRAALDFIPTHVRILASEKLSIMEEVRITEAHGVSVISDIDDTIKHSAISSGAREIFRNVFIRELDDLTIEGVKDWYHRLADMGVNFHYVSNSPWQLFPLLTSFFAKAGLPAGSFHLKQYSGMFQGIFEPVAERKRSSLDKILRDFPERRFLLIGDSGEADLEVYTDVVIEYPGRILGVFIRDITTTSKKGFFDSAMGSPRDSSGRSPASSGASSPRKSGARTPKQRRKQEAADMEAAITASLKEYEAKRRREDLQAEAESRNEHGRPPLPRRPTEPPAPQHHSIDSEEDLIDLDGGSDRPFPPQRSKTDYTSDAQIQRKPVGVTPSRPPKPSYLRNETVEGDKIQHSPVNESMKLPPPRPRKPSTSVDPSAYAKGESTQSASNKDAPPPKPPRPEHLASLSYRSMAKDKISSTYNRLPSPASYIHPQPQSDTQARASSSSSKPNSTNPSDERPPPIPPRKPVMSIPAAAASYASSIYNSATGGAPEDPYNKNENGFDSSYANPLSKREELWRRRWLRAKYILDSKGVVLKGWRVGEDVMEESVKLVETAQREEKERHGTSNEDD